MVEGALTKKGRPGGGGGSPSLDTRCLRSGGGICPVNGCPAVIVGGAVMVEGARFNPAPGGGGGSPSFDTRCLRGGGGAAVLLCSSGIENA